MGVSGSSLRIPIGFNGDWGREWEIIITTGELGAL